MAWLGHPVVLIGGLGFLLLLKVYSWVFREDTSLAVRREDLASVKCHGPVVVLRFARPPRAGLTEVRILVSRAFRRQFFADFNRTFAGVLPEQYRSALDRIPGTGPADQEATHGTPKPGMGSVADKEEAASGFKCANCGKLLAKGVMWCPDCNPKDD